jgi:hypothetical protein
VVKKLSQPPKPRKAKADGQGRKKKRLKRGARPETSAQRKARLAKLDQKKRRLLALQLQLKKMEADHQAGIVHIAFGSRKLFRAPFELEANGYASHEEWREDWRAARSGQCFVLGSKDETAGCQGCEATINEDLSLDLRVRLPDAVLKDPSIARVDEMYLIVKGIRFAHGHENVLTALRCSRPLGEKGAGVAICWRFIRAEKRGETVWYAHVTVDVTAPPLVTGPREAGVLAVDFNAGHLALAETDRAGNRIGFHDRIDTPLRYRTARRSRGMRPSGWPPPPLALASPSRWRRSTSPARRRSWRMSLPGVRGCSAAWPTARSISS